MGGQGIFSGPSILSVGCQPAAGSFKSQVISTSCLFSFSLFLFAARLINSRHFVPLLLGVNPQRVFCISRRAVHEILASSEVFEHIHPSAAVPAPYQVHHVGSDSARGAWCQCGSTTPRYDTLIPVETIENIYLSRAYSARGTKRIARYIRVTTWFLCYSKPSARANAIRDQVQFLTCPAVGVRSRFFRTSVYFFTIFCVFGVDFDRVAGPRMGARGFAVKFYDILSHESSAIITWTPSGKAFQVVDYTRFSEEILLKVGIPSLALSFYIRINPTTTQLMVEPVILFSCRVQDPLLNKVCVSYFVHFSLFQNNLRENLAASLLTGRRYATLGDQS